MIKVLSPKHTTHHSLLTIDHSRKSAKSYLKIYKSAIMFGMNKDNASEQVGELVERLKSGANLSDDQAQKVLETIKDFVVEKYPMLQGAVNNIFGGQ